MVVKPAGVIWTLCYTEAVKGKALNLLFNLDFQPLPMVTRFRWRLKEHKQLRWGSSAHSAWYRQVYVYTERQRSLRSADGKKSNNVLNVSSVFILFSLSVSLFITLTPHLSTIYPSSFKSNSFGIVLQGNQKTVICGGNWWLWFQPVTSS